MIKEIEKRRGKIPLFANDAKVYINDPKNSTRKPLHMINTFSKVAGYIINSQKSVTFLSTNNKQSEKEIKETAPFTIASNNINYLG